METWDAITARRNVREFADRAIPDADLDACARGRPDRAVIAEPSPWDFVLSRPTNEVQ